MGEFAERILRIKQQIAEVEKELKQDERDGYLLRPHVRQRLNDYLESLRDECYDVGEDFFEDNLN